MSKKIRWGILGAGSIAKAFARGVATAKHSELVAVGSRSQEKADKFGTEFNVKHRHGSYEDLLANDEVDAVYICTPHPMHPEWVIKAAEAKKHILSEKPIALNYHQALGMIEAAEANDVYLMEAFMYRCSPQTKKLVELIKGGAIGKVRVIQASFSFHAGFNPEGRLFSDALGGGGILDVGCYTTSFARLVAGAATGKDFLDPIDVKGVGHKGETGVDEWAVAVLRFEDDIVAEISTGVSVGQENAARIYGSEGSIYVPSPWMAGRGENNQGKIIVSTKGKTEEVLIDIDYDIYGIEADVLAQNVEKRQAPSPAMSWADTLGNMKTLDRWRAEVGVEYSEEKWENIGVLRGGELAVMADAPMQYREIKGLDPKKKVSRLVLGCDNQTTAPHGALMYDMFFEHGGTVFDTAYIYGGGKCEVTLGAWIKRRGVRDQVVVLDKGAHTPHCFPDKITSQLKESFERNGLDYLDIYMMHRDNTDVPVGEFIDVMAEHQEKGDFKIYGVSNWTLDRIKEGNAYAEKNGKPGIAAISNNFSLARMVEPPWKGCMAASEPEFKAWLTETQTPLMPWSSQARGFFVRADRDFTEDKELVRCWYSDDNFERLERVQKMAKERGVIPIVVALAFCLNQQFPVFPLIGPRIPSELRTSLPGLDFALTPDEVKWLNLED